VLKTNFMRIAIVTPLRNEKKNIDKLFDSISEQSIDIFLWVILENGSTDGSKKILKQKRKPSNVRNMEILNIKESSIEYALGENYARIVNFGFEYIVNKVDFNTIDYIGILDSDIFLERSYYQLLLDAFSKNVCLGITSGIILNTDGSVEKTSNNWVRGGCRLWRRECFNHSGYIVGPSADALSTAKAICNNWAVYPVINAIAYSRPKGARVNHRYYGESTYFRGCNIFYLLIRVLHLFFRCKFSESYGMFIGYFNSLLKGTQRVTDRQVFQYYRYYPLSRAYYNYKIKKQNK